MAESEVDAHRGLRLQLLSLLRGGPRDQSTEQGRSHERYRRVAWIVLLTGFTRVLQGALSLVAVPLALGHYGPERYGLWMTAGSFMTVMMYVDQGLGFGLVQGIAEANGRDDHDLAGRYVSTSFFSGAVLWLLAALALAAIYPLVPWARLFNVGDGDAAGEAGPVFAVFAGCFIANTLLGVVQKIQNGYQLGAKNTAWQAVASVTGFLGLVVAVKAEAPLPWLVLAMMGAPPLAFALNGVLLFRERPWLRPRWSKIDPELRGRLLRAGGFVLATQVLLAVTMLSDNLVIAQLQGAEAVTGYAVPWRLFNVAQTFLAIAPQALWPAYREAMVRGEHGWVAKAFRRSLRVGLALAVVPAAFLVAFGGPLVRMWVQGRVDPSRGLLAALAASMVVFAIGAAIANFLNALGAVRAQLVLMAIAAVLGLFLKVVLVSRLGPTGAPIASTCAYGAAFVIPGLWLAVRRMRHA